MSKLLWMILAVPATLIHASGQGVATRPAAASTRAAQDARLRGIEILQRAQRAAGGMDRLLTVRDVTRDLEMMHASGARANETVEVVFPQAIRLTERVADVEIRAFFNGSSGWIQSPWGRDEELPDWQREAAEQELMRQWESVLMSDRDTAKTVAFVKSQQVEGRSADLVEITAADGKKIRVSVDQASGDIVTLEYPRIGPHETVATVTDIYSDYRRASNGLRVPFKIRTLSDGLPYMDTMVTRLEYNKGLKAEILGRKE